MGVGVGFGLGVGADIVGAGEGVDPPADVGVEAGAGESMGGEVEVGLVVGTARVTGSGPVVGVGIGKGVGAGVDDGGRVATGVAVDSIPVQAASNNTHIHSQSGDACIASIIVRMVATPTLSPKPLGQDQGREVPPDERLFRCVACVQEIPAGERLSDL